MSVRKSVFPGEQTFLTHRWGGGTNKLFFPGGKTFFIHRGDKHFPYDGYNCRECERREEATCRGQGPEILVSKTNLKILAISFVFWPHLRPKMEGARGNSRSTKS